MFQFIKFLGFLFVIAIPYQAIAEPRCESTEKIPLEKSKEIIGRWEWTQKCHKGKMTRQMLRDFDYLREDVARWEKTRSDHDAPLFPVFLKSPFDGKWWKAPTSKAAGCSQPPYNWMISLCPGGCMTRDQLVLFSDGYYMLSEALEAKKLNLVTLNSEESFISDEGSANLSFQKSVVLDYSKDINPLATNNIVEISTKDGGHIKVTENHPLINGDGEMVRARDIEVGSTLLHMSGEKHEVSNINFYTIDEGVANIHVKAEKETNRIFVVQGYLSGDVNQQRRELSEINRIIFREMIAMEKYGDIVE